MPVIWLTVPRFSRYGLPRDRLSGPHQHGEVPVLGVGLVQRRELIPGDSTAHCIGRLSGHRGVLRHGQTRVGVVPQALCAADRMEDRARSSPQTDLHPHQPMDRTLEADLRYQGACSVRAAFTVDPDCRGACREVLPAR